MDTTLPDPHRGRSGFPLVPTQPTCCGLYEVEANPTQCPPSALTEKKELWGVRAHHSCSCHGPLAKNCQALSCRHRMPHSLALVSRVSIFISYTPHKKPQQATQGPLLSRLTKTSEHPRARVPGSSAPRNSCDICDLKLCLGVCPHVPVCQVRGRQDGMSNHIGLDNDPYWLVL